MSIQVKWKGISTHKKCRGKNIYKILNEEVALDLLVIVRKRTSMMYNDVCMGTQEAQETQDARMKRTGRRKRGAYQRRDTQQHHINNKVIGDGVLCYDSNNLGKPHSPIYIFTS